MHKSHWPLPYTATICCRSAALGCWCGQRRERIVKRTKGGREGANHKPPPGHHKWALSFFRSIISSISLVFSSCKNARAYIVRKLFSGFESNFFKNKKPKYSAEVISITCFGKLRKGPAWEPVVLHCADTLYIYLYYSIPTFSANLRLFAINSFSD